VINSANPIDAADKELPKYTRMETCGFTFIGWTKGTVDANDPKVFSFSPRRWPATSSP
jgi:hypothetical protein